MTKIFKAFKDIEALADFSKNDGALELSQLLQDIARRCNEALVLLKSYESEEG